jgi:hypothetical protein
VVIIVVSVALVMIVLTADGLEAWPFLISRSRDRSSPAVADLGEGP